MSKIFIVECCRGCPSAQLYDLEPLCWMADKIIESQSEIPDWCPLPDLPDRKEEMEYLAVGYNKCLDDILEEIKGGSIRWE